MNLRLLSLPASAALASLLVSASAAATTYEVGAGKPFATIQDTLDMLGPGDVVEVQGDADYPGDLWFRTSGTKAMPITIRGIAVNGKRPRISGIGTEEYHNIVVLFYANHLVFEGFEVIGDANPDNFGIVHKGDDVTIRDALVHGCAGQGLLGTDSESGSLTLESSEFYGNGNDLYAHQIYMATDESMYPGSVFRMRYCYVHDGTGGNNVKSRAERNEIYYNWIEGAVYHELDLIGPDGQDMSLAREDSDVVGNVLVKHSEWRIARIGGDGTGNTAGRYRFVNNTMILSDTSDVAIGLQESVSSVEMHNNVIVRTGGGNGAKVSDYNEPSGPDPVFFGSNNWIQDGIGDVPASFTGTITGADPGFTDASTSDFRPADGSPLIDAGATDTTSGGPGLSNPLTLPAMVPPSRALHTEAARPDDGAPDIGAYEVGSGTMPGDGGVPSTSVSAGPGPSSGPGAGPTPSSGTGTAHGSGAGGGNGDSASGDDGGCGCRSAGETAAGGAAWGLLVLAGIAARRRRPRA